MFTVDDIIFCKEIIFNADGSPSKFVGVFTEWHSESYPAALTLIASVNISFDVALNDQITMRISKDNWSHNTGTLILKINAPPWPNFKSGVNLEIGEVVFPEPGKYLVELFINGIVKHKQHLLFSYTL
jgi:hypothetical protein